MGVTREVDLLGKGCNGAACSLSEKGVIRVLYSGKATEKQGKLLALARVLMGEFSPLIRV